MLKQCKQRNRDGIGIAWKGKEGIEFRRGIGFDKLIKCLKQIERDKAPYVAHFRFATQGSKDDPSLTHPFPVSTKPRELRALRGTAGLVLAHNGTWSRWREAELAEDCGFKKTGSDSMFMAYLLAKGFYFKEDDLKWYHRLAILSEKDGLKLQGQWTLDTETGISYSNSGYRVYKATTYHRGQTYGMGYGGYFDGGWDEEGESDTTGYSEQWLRENGHWTWENGVKIWKYDADKARRGTSTVTSRPIPHAQSCRCFRCREAADAKNKTPDKSSPVMKTDTSGVTHQCYGEYCGICHPLERPRTNINDVCSKCHYLDTYCKCKPEGDVCQIPEADKAPVAFGEKADGKAWRMSSWCLEPKAAHNKCNWQKCQCDCHTAKATTIAEVTAKWKSPWCSGVNVKHHYCQHWKCKCECHAGKNPQPIKSVGCTAGNHEGCAMPSVCACDCGHKVYTAREKSKRLAKAVTEAAKKALKQEKKDAAIVVLQPDQPAQGSFLDGPGRDGKSVAVLLPSFDKLCAAVAFIGRGSKEPDSALVHSTLCDCPVRDGEIWHKVDCLRQQPHVGWMERTLNALTGHKENEGGK